MSKEAELRDTLRDLRSRVRHICSMACVLEEDFFRAELALADYLSQLEKAEAFPTRREEKK